MLVVALASGLTAGLVALPHCTLMCGPLCAYACRDEDPGAPARYQLGRMGSYVLLGVLAGSIGSGVASISGTWGGAVLSWSLALALVVAAVGLWRGARARNSDLVTLERKPAPWNPLRAVPDRALFIGAASALLPCGALAVAVLLSASTGTALGGAAVMLGFSMTSGVGVLVAGAVATRVRRLANPRRRRILAAALVVGAGLLIARPIPALIDSPSEHAPAAHDCPLHSTLELRPR